MIRIVVDPAQPDPAAIERTAVALSRGGVAAIPTDTLYGLAVDPTNPNAIARVFEIKARQPDRALPLVAADTAQVREWIGSFGQVGERLAERFWPGPLTLVMRAPAALSHVSDDRGTVGVRVPAHAVTRALCASCGRPLTATSANISGTAPTANPRELAAELSDAVDILLDAGPTAGGPPSTIVDVTSGTLRLIRAGAIPWDEVLACAEST